jgi:basic membrane lipoprotein Med (substrate-binding protein (PBP1-ABC) superfamily)
MKTRQGVSTAVTLAAVIVAVVIVAGVFYLVPGLAPGGTKTSTVISTSVTSATSTATVVSTSITSATSTATVVSTTSITPTTTVQKQYSMAVVLGGDETDLGFNYVAVQAANLIAMTYGWSVSITRDVPYANQYQVINSLAQSRSYDLIWVVGNQFIGTTEAVANASYIAGNTKTMFAQTPSYCAGNPYQKCYNLTPNIVILDQSFQTQSWYEAGVLAAKMTKTNSIGFVIGQWFPSQSEEFYAFVAGKNATNANVKIYLTVAGTWSDASLGQQIANTMIQSDNTDIIAQVADATGRGVFTAATQHNITVIGTVADQAALAPVNTMTSTLANLSAFIDPVVQHMIAGTWSQIGGTDQLQQIGSLASYHNYIVAGSGTPLTISQAVQTYVANIIQQVNSGQIKVGNEVTQNPPPGPL